MTADHSTKQLGPSAGNMRHGMDLFAPPALSIVYIELLFMPLPLVARRLTEVGGPSSSDSDRSFTEATDAEA
ncbi:uncharacterized protein ColSpa_03033 [Colletotrichum spaethianum]|uniref:Uncharacterized protein n=1 Tax=Colletotrichum spaethianum TaxID=700344 RepID=A0AA37LEQ1_9PEZI|nr:uncharacterized protein ColSpa_03033 [Colletotrichum spaethianum]GKT42852.1 hypothetical protein ColSpa_03033 [Colletotrichum spaethianum]